VSDSAEVIREFLLSHSNQSLDALELERSRDLLEEGVIDSLGLMELVEFLRSHYDLEFEPNEITAENFKTVRTIATLVDNKRQGDG
jgi:acyl carrier protein